LRRFHPDLPVSGVEESHTGRGRDVSRHGGNVSSAHLPPDSS
jgi:hypothetical protein